MKKLVYLCFLTLSFACTTTNRGARLKDGEGFTFPKEQLITANLFVKIAPTKTIAAFENTEQSLSLISDKIPPVLSLWAPCNTSTSNQVDVSHGSTTDKTFCLHMKSADDPALERHLVEFSDKEGLESFIISTVSTDDKLNNFWRLSTLCSKDDLEIFGQKTHFELTEEMALPTIPSSTPGTLPLLATITVCHRSFEIDHRKTILRFAGYGVRFDQSASQSPRVEVLMANRDPKDHRATFEFMRDLQLKSMDVMYLK